MTPKEKAIELVDRFTFRCFECDYEGNAKQCALIAVDEILNIITFDELRYWQEVKQEIELL